MNSLLQKFRIILQIVVVPIFIGIVFFLIVTPIGLFMKLIGKDLLNKKYDKKKSTYWIIRDKSNSSMKRQS